ncbi:MAG: bifunctional diguanylate cyclase/phosphohydrolase [Desulforhopalus sp.]
MTGDKKYIVARDIVTTKAVANLVRQINIPNVCVLSDTTVRPEEYQRALLTITSGDPENVDGQLLKFNVPEHTPLLFLGTENKLPRSLAEHTTARFMDYLRVPVSMDIFRHKVSLLTKVQRVSAEHHASTTTLSQQLDLLYTRDGLTGLYNRRHLTSRLSEMLANARNCEEELSMLVINIDHFSNVNASLGLEFGDFILNEMAARLTRSTRDIDSCYRFSGEEFIVMMPETNLQHALDSARNISAACTEKPYSDGVHNITITVSIGVVSLQEHGPDSPDKFIFMAENALFTAKADGRNRIRSYLPQNLHDTMPQQRPLAFLKDKLNRILNQTRSSAISSLQMMAKNVAGPEHKSHSATVANYLSLLGRQLGLPEKHMQTFHNAVTLYNSFRALLHSDLMAKPGKLTGEERKILEDLPFKLSELTDMFDYFAEERSILLSFTERFDGTGYPEGLSGDEIPLGARIFKIVDAIAAMNSERPYRRKLSPEEIIKELQQEAGRQFDPFLVLQILFIIEKNEMISIDPVFIKQSREELLNVFPELRS